MERSSFRLQGTGLVARVMRSSAWTLLGFGSAQVVRFGSNLVLTRLLFPEAFGMMTLVTVALVALGSVSDLGLGPAINYSRRGDDPCFLDTAWTLQLARGALLFLSTCALALPAARFYTEPMLAQLLPVAGIGMLIGGAMPMSVETANRHLAIGRLTLLDLASQIVGTAMMVLLAWQTGSIWSLVLGGLGGSAAKYLLVRLTMPGRRHRLTWDADAGDELVHFGKWIFLSTVMGFLVFQGDRLILGKYLSLHLLGIYNVGYFLATAPMQFGVALAGRIMIPVFRERPPSAARENFESFRRVRLALSGSVVAGLLLVAAFAIPLVDLLYDPRFHAAGPIAVMIALAQIPTALQIAYDQAALAAGDSRRFFFLMAPRAGLLVLFMLVGAHLGGLAGALTGQALAAACSYPLTARLARRFAVWDAPADAVLAAVGIAIGGVLLWLNAGEIALVAKLG